jgi:hypothetical protein
VPDGFILSAELLAELRRWMDAQRRTPTSTPQRPAVPGPDAPGRDVYLVLTPSTGIPAAAGRVPGVAACAAWRVVGGTLEPAAPAVAVYNAAPFAVAGASHCKAVRDSYGSFWCVDGPPDAPAVSFDETDLRCEPVGTGTGGGSLNLYRRTLVLTWPGGCPSARLTPWTLVRAVACCDPACATGPPAVDCGTCVSTLPATLCLNVYASAECPCWDGVSFDVTNTNPAYPTWMGGQDQPQCVAASGGLPPASAFARFECASSGTSLFALNLDVGGGLRTFYSDPATQNCSPLYAKFRVPMNTATSLTGCSSADGYLDVVVTEPPCAAGTGTGGPGTGGGACGITDQGLGAADNSGVNPTAFIPSVVVAAGKLLLVNVSGTGTDAGPASVTIGGTPLTFEAGIHRSGSVFVTRYYLKAPPGGLSGNLVATRGAGTTALQLNAVAVDGLPVGAPSTAAVTAQGGGTAPTAAVMAAACSYTFAGAVMSPATAGSWPAPVTAGGQDDSAGGVRLTEAFRKEVAGGTTTATYSGVTPADWGLVLGNYV